MSTPSPTAVQSRVCILIAAILWSLSGVFTKTLTQPTFLDVHELALFAGLVLMPTLRVRAVQFRPMMFGMLACFALMNALFLWRRHGRWHSRLHRAYPRRQGRHHDRVQPSR